MNEESTNSGQRLQARVVELEEQLERLHNEVFTRRKRTWRARLQPDIFVFQQYWPRSLQIPDGYRSEALPSPLPTIAMVTPSRNHGRFIERTIKSVLDQNYPKLAYTIQDGGSDDDTADILKGYAGRVVSVCEPDGGQADAINRGFKRVSGDIMAWLNSDDVLLPGTLAYVTRFMSEHPEIDLVYGHRICIDSEDREIGRGVLPPHDDRALRWFDYIPQEGLFWRRRVWERLGGLDTSFVYALDWDFVLRAAAAGFRFHRLPRFLGGFRVHPAQKTTHIVDIGREEMARLRRQYLGSAKASLWTKIVVSRYFMQQRLLSRRFRHGLIKF